MTGRAGYSLVELLVGAGLTLAIIGATLPVVQNLQLGFTTEGERADLQQRLRVASQTLVRHVGMAGAGTHQGGGLGFHMASVFPFRRGALSPDPPGTFKRDTLTVLFVPGSTAAQTTIQLPVSSSSETATINIDAGCPPADSSCAFARGADLIVYDDTGAYDTYRVLDVLGSVLQLQHSMPDSGQLYRPGAWIAEVAAHTYFLKPDPAGDGYQLVHDDGVHSASPVVDHVVGLSFEYFGEPSPPVFLGAGAGPPDPATSYGPRPPPTGERTTAYPAGENCVFQLDASGQPISRLPQLGAGTTLVPLTAEQLVDGPWCPDELSTTRYDADLLRIRKIGMTLRVEAASSALRGPASVLFSRGGTSRAPGRWIEDHEVRFEVTPPNLNVPR